MTDETEITTKIPTPIAPEPAPPSVTTSTIVEKTETTGATKPAESHIWSISVRALIALIVICTVCFMAIKVIDIKEPLYTLSVAITAFFFGQQTKPKNQQ